MVTARWSVNGLIIICVRILCRTSIDLRYILYRRVELLRRVVCVSLSGSCVIPRAYEIVLESAHLIFCMADGHLFSRGEMWHS